MDSNDPVNATTNVVKKNGGLGEIVELFG